MSNTLAHLQTHMQALGPTADWIESIIQDDDQSWSLHTTQGVDIGVSFASSPARLILSALIGTPDEVEREAVYATMLCTNLLYVDQAALRVALTGPEGELMLISETTPADWHLSEIIDALSEFSATALNFMDTLQLSVESVSETSVHAAASLRV